MPSRGLVAGGSGCTWSLKWYVPEGVGNALTEVHVHLRVLIEDLCTHAQDGGFGVLTDPEEDMRIRL